MKKEISKNVDFGLRGNPATSISTHTNSFLHHLAAL